MVRLICDNIYNTIAILRVAEKEPWIFQRWFLSNSKLENEFAILAIEEILSRKTFDKTELF